MEFREQEPGEFWPIRVENAVKAFGDHRVLNGLNLGIPEGMIIGLMFPDSGDVKVHGQSVPKMRMPELLELRKRVGILFQDGALFGSMNVFDNVAYPLRQNTTTSEREIHEIVDRRLDEVGLSAAEHAFPNELSGGMRKRAGFARALVLEPEIVMFDEPDSGLDPVRTALLCQLIQKVHGQNGGTYIVITHDIASAHRIGEYLAVLWKGRIVQSGDREAMFSSENPFVRQFLAGAEDGPLGMD
jgi:phospholipid/cholesterol/gamma-HCH transport system ATP-binding protein